jgi:signal transduction histidine kinase
MMLRSIRARLMAWHLAVIAVLLGVFSVALYSSVAHSLYLEVDVRLLSKAEELINYAHTGQIDFERDQIAFSTEDLLIQVSRLDGTVLHKSLALRASPLPLDTRKHSQGPQLQTVSAQDGTPLRLVTNLDTTEEGDPVFVQVATPLTRVQSALERLRFWLLTLVPVLLALASLGSYFLADRMVRPLRIMAQTAQTISAGNLSQRLPVPTPSDEVGQLATTFNEMFERLHQAFEHQRRFVSNASHELRTPLTVLRGQVEVALRKARSPEEYRQALQAALAQAERLSRLTEQLLLLARTESGAGSHA